MFHLRKSRGRLDDKFAGHGPVSKMHSHSLAPIKLLASVLRNTVKSIKFSR